MNVLDYRPLNVKCWYWKGLVADQRGSAKKQLRLPSMHWNVLAGTLRMIIYRCIFRSMSKRYWTCGMWKMRQGESTRHEDYKSCKGPEPLHWPFPKLSQYEGTGLNLSPPKGSSPS